jgi:hypothetical protein
MDRTRNDAEGESMRELPEPTTVIKLPNELDGNLEYHETFTRDQVLAIQKQAYEDGLRDSASLAKVISDKYAFGYYGQEVDTADEIEAEILAMLTASQKEPK